jgi:hypothetical protein
LARPAEWRHYFYTWPQNLWAYAVLLEQAGKSAEEIAEATAMDLRSVELALNPEPPKRNGELRHIYGGLRNNLLYFWCAEAYRRAASVAALEGYPELASPCQVLADYFKRKRDQAPGIMDCAEVWGDDFVFLDGLATDDARVSIGLEGVM